MSKLHECVQKNDYTEVYKLILENANLNVTDVFGRTPLFCAVMNRQYNMIGLLCMHGAKVDSIDNWGMTALDLAIEYKSKIMVTLLTSLGGKNLYALSSSDNEIEKFIEGNQKDNFKKAYEYVRPYMILFNKNMIEQYYDGYLSRISVDGFRNTIDNQKEQLKDFLKTRKYLYSCDGDCNMKMIDDIQEMINEKLEEFQMRKSLTL